MKCDPAIYRHYSIRLKGYDYTQAGAYFITICTRENECLLGEIVNEKMVLNDLGQVVYDQWHRLPKRFSNIVLDHFVVMPNHIHGILFLIDSVRAGLAPAPGLVPVLAAPDLSNPPITDSLPRQTERRDSLGNIVGAYKSLVANECLRLFKSRNEYMGKLWHRNYYEHIIRNEKAYSEIASYILNNPLQWELDKFHQ